MGNTCIPVADSLDIWQNQYNIVKFKNKIKFKKKMMLLTLGVWCSSVWGVCTHMPVCVCISM